MKPAVPVLAAALALAACTPPTGPLRMPIESIHRPARCAESSLRIVMLPGAYSRAEDFVTEGFTDALSQHGIDADLKLVDAHYGYYADGSLVDRIAADFLPEDAPPAWLVGISLGGYGALAVAARHPERVAGVIVIAPYPGTRDTQREIAAAGGLAAWAAREGPGDETLDPATRDERRLWRWLAGRPATPPVYAGLADSDRFLDGQRLLTSMLPPERVDLVAGGHDWPAWRQIWERFLDRGVLAPTGAPCAGLQGRGAQR